MAVTVFCATADLQTIGISGTAVLRVRKAVSVFPVVVVLALAWPGAAPVAAEHPATAQPAQSPQQPAAQPPAAQAPAPEHVQVEGFRSAHWGMTDAQVKAAIHKDFNIPPDKVQTEENASERTTVLSVTVNDLLEGTGKTRISYILGYSTKKLIQANVVWGTTIDPQAKPERIVAAANQLRTLFLSSGYEADTIASNVATADGTITVFQGQDSEKHTTLLRLVSTPAPAPAKPHAKAESAGPAVVLLLSYVMDARNPDVYRLKKGQF